MNVQTHFERKPIPDGRWDWAAWLEGDEEFGAAYAPTESAAIAALQEMINERETA